MATWLPAAGSTPRGAREAEPETQDGACVHPLAEAAGGPLAEQIFRGAALDLVALGRDPARGQRGSNAAAAREALDKDLPAINPSSSSHGVAETTSICGGLAAVADQVGGCHFAASHAGAAGHPERLPLRALSMLAWAQRVKMRTSSGTCPSIFWTWAALVYRLTLTMLNQRPLRAMSLRPRRFSR